MTSRNLFFKLIRQDYKKRIWCPLLLFVAFFLFMEVKMLMKLENIEKFPKRFPYDISTYVCDYFFGRELAWLAIAVCAAAFLCALSGFAYMHVKCQIDLYHSLPVSRSQLFWAKYMSGILQFFLPFLVHVLICAGIAVGRKIFTSSTFFAVLICLGIELLIFILAYSVSVLAVGLTGNMIISILGTGILFTYSTIIAVLVNVLFHKFFKTFVVYGNVVSDMMSEKIWCFSPMSMIIKLFANTKDITAGNIKEIFKYNADYIWVLVLAAVLYSLLAYVVYRKRESEAAGRMIAFGAAEPVIKTLTVIPAAFFCGDFFSEITTGMHSDKWYVFGLIFGYIVLACLLEVIFRADIRGIFQHKKQFLFNAACTALIFIIFKNDVLGFNTYVPADSQLQSCAVSIEELMPISKSIHVPYAYNGYYEYYSIGYNEYRMKHMEIQGNPSAMALARKAAKEGLTYAEIDYYEGSEEDSAYKEIMEKQAGYRNVSFGYRLLNGKTVYRRYTIDIADAETLKLLSDIFNSYDYKLGSIPLFTEGWDEEYAVVSCTNNWKSADIKLTHGKQAKLLETYQSECTKLTLDTVMHTPPVGKIAFFTADEIKRKYLNRNTYSSDGMLIYPEFTKTIALLKEYGFDMNGQITADDVASITVHDHNFDDYDTEMLYSERDIFTVEETVFTSYMEELINTKYTDKEEIQQILDSILSADWYWLVSEYAEFYETRYSVYIEYEKEDDADYYGYLFKKGCVPNFVEKNSNKNQ